MRKILVLAVIVLVSISVAISKTEYINWLPGPYQLNTTLDNATAVSTTEETYNDEAIYLNFNQDNYFINTVKPKSNPVPMPRINLKDFNATS